MSWNRLPAAARAIAVAACEAVDAAQHRDRDRLDVAVPALAAAEGSGLVLGAVVRLLLETSHPNGISGDDVQRILDGCLRSAAAWQPDVEPHLMLVLLASALGVEVADEGASPPAPTLLAGHAALLIAHLLAPAGRALAPYLTAAFAEIERTEQQD